MSLSFLRESIIKSLQERTDKLAQSAIDMRVHHEMSADTYAMLQIDILAQARAYADAMRVVTAEYKKLTESDAPVPEIEKKQQKVESVYG